MDDSALLQRWYMVGANLRVRPVNWAATQGGPYPHWMFATEQMTQIKVTLSVQSCHPERSPQMHANQGFAARHPGMCHEGSLADVN